MGKGKPTYINEQTAVKCWEQPAGTSEVQTYQKKGMQITHTIYFIANPNVTSRHQILVTSKQGVAVASPEVFDVMSSESPDASAGLGVVWRVQCRRIDSAED